MAKLASSMQSVEKKTRGKLVDSLSPSAYGPMPVGVTNQGVGKKVSEKVTNRLRGRNRFLNEHIKPDGTMDTHAAWEDRAGKSGTQSAAREHEQRSEARAADAAETVRVAAEKSAYDASHPSPVLDSSGQKLARRRTAARQQRTGGRLSTVLSDSEGLG
jgi:hypothetical protein